MEYNRKAHSVYLLTYHIVFVTKYRRPVISDEIGYFMKNHAAYLCGRFGGEMVSAETDEDHIHLLVSMPPDVAPSRLVATLFQKKSGQSILNMSGSTCGGTRRSGAIVILLQLPGQRLWRR